MVIDDDTSAIENICNIFDWNSLNVTEVIRENDVSDLTQKIKQQKPDIIMIDIEMGDVSGLDIVEKCKNEGSDALFVIISGHYSFHYAKEAIRLDVIYYLSKPIMDYDVDEATQKLIARLNTRAKNPSDLIDDISTFLSGEEEFNRFFQANRLDFNEKYKFIITDADDGMLEEIGKLCLGEALHSKYKIGIKKYLFIIKNSLYTNKTQARLKSVSATRRTPIGISDEFDCIENMYSSFKEAYALSFGKFIYERNDVFQNEEFDKKTSDEFSHKWIDSLESLSRGNTDEFEQFISTVPEYFKNNKFDLRHVAFLYNSAAYKINSLTKSIMNGEYLLFLNMEDILTEYESLKVMCNELLLLAKEVLGNNNAEARYSSASFDKILKYINENYNKSISLEELSEMFNVSISYICKHFKEKLNKTFLEYQKNIRINHAKYLLKNSQLSVMEVSEKVGYPDYYYFNRVFKAQTGFTPGKFKKMNE